MHLHKQRILLLGATGQVGWELLRTLQPLGEVLMTVRQALSYFPAAYTLDLTHLDQVKQLIRTVKPDIIVNAAAYTAVDKAEQEQDQADVLNTQLPALLAAAANSENALLVHYSTDYIFDGTTNRPYQEIDQPAPMGVYGQTKWAGEQAIIQIAKQYLILRTSWVYAIRGHNFFLTMLKLANERDCINVVSDQIGSPTWSRLIAETTASILTRLQSPPISDIQAIFNVTCEGQTSWYGFAQKIIEGSEYQCQVSAITTDQYPTPAKRPAYSVLSGEHLAERLNIVMPDWQIGLQLCFAELGIH